MNPLIKIALGSLVVGVVVLGLKAWAYTVTGSVALYSDALESTVNVATALAALMAVYVAAQPADDKHPYGHHKAEYLSAVLAGTMIIGAALMIFYKAYQGFITPHPIEAPWLGLIINGGASVLNAAWCWVLITQGRRQRSAALVADGQHLLTDVISSAGVAVGLGLAVLTGLELLDPLLGTLVALNILFAGWQLMQRSLSGLLDEAVPAEVLLSIKQVIAAHATGALEAHDLRTRHAGKATFIDFHLVIPGATTVHEAHVICDRIEAALKAQVPDAWVTIHVEPEDKAKQGAGHHGVVVL
jgi:cation diffusion facilitator family transporter